MAETPFMLIVAGHRSTGNSGDDVERQMTDDLASAYSEAFSGAGFETRWWQRDLDANALPTMTQGSLDTVALGCGKVLRERPEALSIMLDLHLDTRRSVVHTIVPDTVGLTTRYEGGAPAVDTAANNPLDVDLAKAISRAIADATGLPIYPRKLLDLVGVMSERETRVGTEFSARLAMFAASAGSRRKAARLVIEHAGTSQLVEVANWPTKSANAALKAVTQVLKDRGVPAGSGTGNLIQPDEPPSEFDFAEPEAPTELELFVQAGVVVRVPPPIVTLATGEQLMFTGGSKARAIRRTRRLRNGREDALSVGPDLEPGEVFSSLWMYRSDDGNAYWVTGWWTRIRVDDTEIVLSA